MSWQVEMGAQVAGDGVSFRVWAPAARAVEVETYPGPGRIERHAMAEEDEGVWGAVLPVAPGTLYRYRLDGEWAYPDPYSRSQPEGVHGPSEVVDPTRFRWTDGDWHGLDPEQLVLYECHIGTYTPEGTFDAFIGELDALRDLGVTAIELMPVAQFAGRRNWGYDGVDLYAPCNVYGGPEALRRLIDAAHARGLGVIIDVVYNHLGPEGNYLASFSPYYFTDRYDTPWGDAINFDGEHSRRVRGFFVQNALYWLHEFHADGLRLDATHRINDGSAVHILRELKEATVEHGIPGRSFFVMTEDERNDLRIVRPASEGGYGLDAIWVDDFHHSVHVHLTDEDRGYLNAYEGSADEIARLLRVGYLYQHPPPGPEPPAGVAPVVPAHRLIYCLQNHDQVGNRPFGRRIFHLIDLEPYKAALTLLLLSPCTPLLFMGDEFISSKPFYYFTDYEGELAHAVREGRQSEFTDFWSTAARARSIPDPQADDTFLQSRLDLTERGVVPHSHVLELNRALLRIRREDCVFRRQDRWRLLAEAPSPSVVALERWDEDEHRRLLVVNFGDATPLDTGAQAWLGDAARLEWRAVLATAEERFAGPGVELASLTLRPGRPVDLPARCAVAYEAFAV